jgi:hypothetical protein
MDGETLDQSSYGKAEINLRTPKGKTRQEYSAHQADVKGQSKEDSHSSG